MSDRCVANPSLAHTVGNVTYKFTEFLKNMFGKNLFKHTHVNTRMAFTEFKKFNNSNHEIIKKNKPILSINPAIDLRNDDIFLSRSLFTTNMNGQSFQNEGGHNFMPFFRDQKNCNEINFLMNRIRVNFGVSMVFDTSIQQINIYNMLRNFYNENQPYYYPTALEVLIPRSIMQFLAVDSGKPIYNDKGDVSEFLNYMNMNSNRYVTFKEKSSTATEEFFMYYPLRIEYFFSDFNAGDLNKKGFISSSAEITFTLTAEFNTVGLYEYISATNSDILKKYDYNMDIDYVNQELIVPFYTYDKMFTLNNDQGWKYFTSRMFKIDNDDDEAVDNFDISTIFESTCIKDVIEYHNKHSIPQEVFFDIKLMMGDNFLVLGKDFEFDYKTLSLITMKVNSKATYRFIIYINNEYINELFEKINIGDMKYDTPMNKKGV